IHAGRSRNDLVASDLRLWCRRAGGELRGAVAGLIEVLCVRAEEHLDSVMPGYTHLQPAQPVSLGFHLVAHAVALERDAGRFEWARAAADRSALGAGALAGTTLALDPALPASEMGFGGVFDNAMDAVSDRDFACDLAYACALCAVHLSRLAEELVMWASPHFGFVVLPDEWSTGSSMMPQKRNPDLAELTRGRAPASIGELSALLALLKGLPLAYDRDLQEDKSLVFACVERTAASVEAMTHLVAAAGFDTGEMARAAARAGTWATDLAEALVARGVPFRRAHAATGALVARLEAEGTRLDGIPVEELRRGHEAFAEEDLRFADPSNGMRARGSRGGTAPERVEEQIASLRDRLRRLGTGDGP
ncbi:MAG: argininosuccinate lyase, partial [Actinomycetota bacterium]